MAQALKGRQQPRIVHRPNPRLASRGPEMVEFARSYGLELDEWQQRVLIDGCRVRRGKWASFEVGLCVGRQNGKNEVLVARELYALFEERVGLIIHSAHLYDTSIEHFQRLFSYVDNSDELSRKLKRRPTWTHGMEGFQLTTGERMRFRTRSRGGGRGFSGDLLVLQRGDRQIDPRSDNAADVIAILVNDVERRRGPADRLRARPAPAARGHDLGGF